MPLSWNEIKTRAVVFSREWENAHYEKGETQLFYKDFFDIFGIPLRKVGFFEKSVTKLNNQQGFIDLFWPGTLLVEQKSTGRSLEYARKQVFNDYLPGISTEQFPRYILLSDFQNFELLDLETGEQAFFKLSDLHKNVHRFAFIAGYQTHKIKGQDPVNIKAAELMGKLHDQLRDIGYAGHDLEVYLVRLLFCLFAEDTGIFQRQQFQDYIEDRTFEDGADLGHHLVTFFHLLNTPSEKRLSNQDEQLNAFPYVNGKLFEEMLPPAAFDSAMRQALLACCALDWSRISPAIFGSLFQSIMDEDARRNLGAHYTSEQNILKLINPLFMDDLRAEFNKVKNNKNKLFEFHKKLRTLAFLDPACGCGNFLVIAYRELRLLELEVLRAAHKNGQMVIDIHQMIQLDVDQFYGIEIEEFPAQIAQVALWLVDHQMNLLVSQEFGMYFARIPLQSSAKIVHGNALRMVWRNVIAPERLNYIMGNPPFIGHQYQSAEQKTEMLACYQHINKAGIMDYVTAWYCKAVDYIADTDIRCAFVSTNSITQGEQVAPLWNELRARNKTHIHFAHRTFKWSNEGRGKAAVYCVIIGFGLHEAKTKKLFEYENIKGDAHEIKARNINPYLVDGPDVIVKSRNTPLCLVAPVVRGSSPVDGGNLLLSEEEKQELITAEPQAEEWIKPYSMGNEFINDIPRFCLWLKHCPPDKLRKMPNVMKRVEAVKEMRSKSAKTATQKYANQPTIFMEDRQGDCSYLAIPRVSSERRDYIPIGYLPPDHIAGDKLYTVPNADSYLFGVITSSMHMAWMRAVCGRLESRYSYSNTIVYNNFPWPKTPTEKQTADIETKAQAILDARAQFLDSTLADLYDPLTMPPLLQKAHNALDKAVDRAYHRASDKRGAFNNEADRVSFLFDLYQQYTAPILPEVRL
ncbi:class I SAM-dependent DNA methyltransferase [Candidatus Spongiihabitans sp.]|uniref:class I SAM-dependent DNA methyltransferase n=1 Tax=Candidatus Spongiihabitans sp. TaxID=3101308 RepID=UPI003C7049DB